MDDYTEGAYGDYLAGREHVTNLDREVRLDILEAAAAVEDELISVAVFYLGGGSKERQELVDRHIFKWGGRVAAENVLRTALELHEELEPADKEGFEAVKDLIELRNLVAHGRTRVFESNDPDQNDGRLGRRILKRSVKGKVTWERIDFDEAKEICAAGEKATHQLAQKLADITRRMPR